MQLTFLGDFYNRFGRMVFVLVRMNTFLYRVFEHKVFINLISDDLVDLQMTKYYTKFDDFVTFQ